MQAIVSSTGLEFVHLQLFTSGNIGVYTDTGFVALPIITPTPVGVWRHVAMSVRSGDTQLYVNGSLVGTNTQTFTSIVPTSDLRIGSGYNQGRFFNGDIDEVGVYNRALSAAEVQAIHAAGGAGKGHALGNAGSGVMVTA